MSEEEIAAQATKVMEKVKASYPIKGTDTDSEASYEEEPFIFDTKDELAQALSETEAAQTIRDIAIANEQFFRIRNKELEKTIAEQGLQIADFQQITSLSEKYEESLVNDIAERDELIKELQAQVQKSEQQRETDVSDKNKLLKSVTDLTDKLAKSCNDDTIKHLTEEMKKLRAEKAHTEELVHCLEIERNDAEELSFVVANLEEELKTSESLRKELEEKALAHSSDDRVKRSEYEESLASKFAIEQNLVTAETSIKSLKAELNEKETACDKCFEDISIMENKIASGKVLQEELEKELDAYKLRCQDAEGLSFVVSDLEEKLEASDFAKNRLREEVATLQRTEEDKTLDQEQALAKITSLTKELASSESVKKDLYKQLAQSKEDESNHQKNLVALSNLEQEMANIDSERKLLKAELEDKVNRSEYERSTAHIFTLEQELAYAESSCEEVKKELLEIRTERVDFLTKISLLEDELVSTKKQVDEKEYRNEKNLLQISSLKQDLLSTKSSTRVLEEKLDEKKLDRSEYEECLANTFTLEQELANTEYSRRELQKELEENKVTVSTYEKCLEKISTLEEEFNSTKYEKDDLEREIQQHKTLLSCQQAELDSSDNLKKDLENDLNRAKATAAQYEHAIVKISALEQQLEATDLSRKDLERDLDAEKTSNEHSVTKITTLEEALTSAGGFEKKRTREIS